MPVLENSQGQLVYESAITCEYLDEVYPGKKLLPEDPYEKACQKMTFELFSKVCGEEISVPVWKNPLLFKLPRCCHLRFSNLERIILLSALTCPASPFLISFCLPLQSYPFSPFSQHFIFQPYWMFPVFPNSPPYQLLLGGRLFFFSLCLLIPNPLSCICSDTAAFQKLVQTWGMPSSVPTYTNISLGDCLPSGLCVTPGL